MGSAGGGDSSKAKVTGNDSLFGQISTFIESLHLSYDDVVYRIPYQNLIMMNADKLRVSYGDEEKEPEVKKISGREMLKSKGR